MESKKDSVDSKNVADVTYNEVAMSANKMIAAGKKPSARLVYLDIRHGSMGTINKYYKQWEADQALHLPAPNTEILSTDINRSINLTIATKVAEATAKLKESLAEENEILLIMQKEYEQLEADHKNQTAILAEMESQYANLTGRAELLESENKSSGASLSYERKMAETARSDLIIANYKLERLSQLEAEVEMLRSELKLANNQAAEFSKVAAVAEAKYESELNHRKAA